MRIVKLALALVAVLALLVAGGVGYLFVAFPDVGPAPEIEVEITPERVARGRYLAEHVCVCLDCHAERDWTRFAGPPKPATLGAGGEVFDQTMGFPGAYHASNITPAGIGDWSDGEVYRAITAGVGREGRPLFPIMPYKAYGKLGDGDVYAIIAFLRSLDPIEHTPPASRSDFPMSLIIRTLPGEPEERLDPGAVGSPERARYVTNAAGCLICHTREEQGQPVPGMEGAGGFEFPLPTGVARSANITPHEATGIGTWTREFFIQRFKLLADVGLTGKIGPGDMQTTMPWTMYAGMTEEDLGAIYDHLRTLPPIDNEVEHFTPAGS